MRSPKILVRAGAFVSGRIKAGFDRIKAGYHRLMDIWWGQFLIFFFWELATFFMLSFNFRVLAKGSYFWTILSDGVLSANGMIGIAAIAKDKRAQTKAAIIGNSVGGMCGSAIGIFVTKRLLGS